VTYRLHKDTEHRSVFRLALHNRHPICTLVLSVHCIFIL